MSAPRRLGVAGRFAQVWISSKLTPLIITGALLLGAFAVWRLPREEEPQLIVPMIDVFVQMPGSSAREVEERLTKPMEKLLWETPGVEYIYSTSSPGMSLAIVRFRVGQDEEKSIVQLNQKLHANLDLVPPGATPPLVKPRSIDDVPILALTFSSRRYADFELRQIAAQATDAIKQVPDVSAVTVIGGQRREVRVVLDEGKLAAYNLSPIAVAGALGISNRRLHSGQFDAANREYLLETGEFLRTAEDVRNVVAGVVDGKAVFLRDVAEVSDGGEEPSQYVRIVRSDSQTPAESRRRPEMAASLRREFLPAVTVAVAKRKGANAVTVAENVLKRLEPLKGNTIPSDVSVDTTRHYGETAAEKSNELLFHMLIAVVSVSVLIAITLGFRESLIVFIAIPVTLALTLTVFYLYGYTLNRITLFALIFSIGILVDDAIVVVENIVRHWRMPANRERPPFDVAIEAVDEVGNPTILATLTVVAAILPMAFVGGLMGPYMRPIPIGASAAMLFSLLVAFIVTPWAAVRILKPGHASAHGDKEDLMTRIYRRVMGGLLHTPVLRWGFLLGVATLLVGAVSLFYTQFVKVKMLPFDNKSEFQVIVDMPNGTTLEETARAANALVRAILDQPEVVNLQTYVGVASPFNFNGLVRHYYLRQGSNVADIQVNLQPKGRRTLQSHEIAKQVRQRLLPVAERYGARVKVAEVPPGPPVLQTLVAEVYGPEMGPRIDIARRIRDLWKGTSGVVDVDWYVEDDQPRYRLVADKEKAALHGISEDDIAKTMALASSGYQAGLLHADSAKEDVPLMLRLDRASRSDLEKIRTLKVAGRSGRLVSLGELVRPMQSVADKSIYHKNLMPVTYVTGDVAGAMESPVYAILKLGPEMDKFQAPGGYAIEQHMSSFPTDSDHYSMKWDGEWHITYEVFRDLGVAFAAVLILIYGLMVGWFQSFITPLVIMAAIPFSLAGILPAHGALHAFFTATSMIGFIAGAGIVVRNSIILVDFIELRLREGMPLEAAVVDAGAVRFRPMMLTAAAVVVGAGVILFDPIFQGLAIALMAGEVASLALSRMTVPIVYFVVNRRRRVECPSNVTPHRRFLRNAERRTRLFRSPGLVLVHRFRGFESVPVCVHQVVSDDHHPAEAGYGVFGTPIDTTIGNCLRLKVSGELKSDAELAAGLFTGDEKAFTDFVEAFHARLSRYSFLMCGHREDAEEIAQETLLKVFESIDQLRDPSRLKAWVFRIAKNECFIKRRKSVFAPQRELSLDELKPRKLGEGHSGGIEIADWNALPEDLLLDTELQDALTRSIQNLPENYRSVVLLRDVEELTTEEAAEILDISTDLVKTRLHRGRLALRQEMDRYLRNSHEASVHER